MMIGKDTVQKMIAIQTDAQNWRYMHQSGPWLLSYDAYRLLDKGRLQCDLLWVLQQMLDQRLPYFLKGHV